MKDISARIMCDEARKMGFKVKTISEDLNMFEIKNGKKTVLFKSIDCGINSSLGMRFARYKKLTYFMLEQYGIKVPKSIIVESNIGISDKLKEAGLKFPLVVKPSVGEHGDGVSVNLKNLKEIGTAIKFALKYDNKVLVQEFFKGGDFRIIIIGHKFVAAMNRVPAYIIGDGKNSIKEILKKENNNPLRGEGHEKNISKILVDKELKRYIANQGFDLSYILPKGKKIFVRKNANLSTGGTSIDVSNKIHPEIIKMCEMASKVLQLNVCGVDYLSEDITKPLKQQKGGIIEVNHTPGLRGHHFPFEGKSNNVAKEILKLALK
ncbi:MAG: hypothetical protein WAZ12_02555 [Candidatus Absconditicoccaceae bacterium]